MLPTKNEKSIKSNAVDAPIQSGALTTVQSKLAGLFARVGWRPRGTAGAESIVAGITGFTSSLAAAARNLAWHSPSAYRRRPWPGWSRLSLRFKPVIDNSSPSLSAYLPTRHGPDVSSLAESPSRKGAAGQPDIPQVASSKWPQLHESRVEHSTLHSESLAPFAPAHRGIYMTSTAKADLSVSVPKLAASARRTPVTSVSKIFRREVPGGFPFVDSVFSWQPQSDSTIAEPHMKASVVSREHPSPTTSAQLRTEIASRVDEKEGVIERLIERTVQPTTLSGLQVKLASKDTDIHGSEKPAATRVVHAEQPKDAVAAVTEPAGITAVPPAAPLDINLVAGKVYQMLMRRQQLEQERRGLY